MCLNVRLNVDQLGVLLLPQFPPPFHLSTSHVEGVLSMETEVLIL